MNIRIIAAIALSLLSGAALAQTDTPPSTNQSALAPVTETAPPISSLPARIPEAAAADPKPVQPPNTVPRPEDRGSLPITNAEKPALPVADADKGLKTADVTDVSVRFVDVKPAYVMSSNLIGTNVYDNQNDAVGSIRDLVIDSNRLAGVIVNVGGFLGLAESYIVLDPATIVVTQKDGVWRAYVNTSRDSLKAAPKFTYAKK